MYTPMLKLALCSTQGPKQAQVVATILKSMGVEDYEPRVVVQLLEFMQRMSQTNKALKGLVYNATALCW